MTPSPRAQQAEADDAVIGKHEVLAAKVGGTEVAQSETSSAVWMTDGTDAAKFRAEIQDLADVDPGLFNPADRSGPSDPVDRPVPYDTVDRPVPYDTVESTDEEA